MPAVYNTTLLHTSLLYDKIINVVLYRIDGDNPEESLSVPIKCPETGRKPSLSFSVNMIPNSVCYRAVLTITNASFLRSIDVRSYNVMSVELGYRTGTRMTFLCPIFSAYNSKPNPDGEIVFEGLTVGKVGVRLFKPGTVHVTAYRTTVSIYELVSRYAEALGLKTNFQGCSQEVQDANIHFVPFTRTYSSGFEAITELQSILYNWGKKAKLTIEGGPGQQISVEKVFEIYVNLAWENDTLYLVDNFGDPSSHALKETCIDLSMVKSASFAGPLLTVSAMYIPEMRPGSLFHMHPSVFTGGATLPNAIEENVFNPDQGYYRCLTMSVKFSTTTNENEMSLTALPISQLNISVESPGDYATAANLKKVLQATVTTQPTLIEEADIDIVFGQPNRPAEEDVPDQSMFTINYNPSNGTSVANTKTDDVGSNIARWNTWEQIGAAYYGNEFWHVNLPHGGFEISAQGVQKKFFFPLMILASYRKSLLPGGSGYKIDPDNPDHLRADTMVFIPNIDPDSFVQNKASLESKQVVQLMQKMADYYNNIGLYSYANNFKTIASYIQDGEL